MDHLLRDRIGGAREAHGLDAYARAHGLDDLAEAYRRLAREVLAHNHLALGHAAPPQLAHAGTRRAYVSGGWWVVRCAEPRPDGSWGPGCRNCPHPEVGSRIAVCLTCGRVYDVEFPADADAAEAALLARGNPRTRNYFWHASHPLHLAGGRPETAASLRRENRARGLGRRGGR